MDGCCRDFVSSRLEPGWRLRLQAGGETFDDLFRAVDFMLHGIIGCVRPLGELMGTLEVPLQLILKLLETRPTLVRTISRHLSG